MRLKSLEFGEVKNCYHYRVLNFNEYFLMCHMVVGAIHIAYCILQDATFYEPAA